MRTKQTQMMVQVLVLELQPVMASVVQERRWQQRWRRSFVAVRILVRVLAMAVTAMLAVRTKKEEQSLQRYQLMTHGPEQVRRVADRAARPSVRRWEMATKRVRKKRKTEMVVVVAGEK
jgi:hypothetical protein